jgi:hypothetical protein
VLHQVQCVICEECEDYRGYEKGGQPVELVVVLEPAVLQIKAENKISIGTKTMQWKVVKI